MLYTVISQSFAETKEPGAETLVVRGRKKKFKAHRSRRIYIVKNIQLATTMKIFSKSLERKIA